MYLSKLTINGLRAINKQSSFTFDNGLNIIVGENGCGKSTLIDAIRLILFEDGYSRTGIEEKDFHRDIKSGKYESLISIKATFTELSEDQRAIYLTWLDNNFDAVLNLNVERKYDNRYRLKRNVWGGESSNSIFEWDILNGVQCVYLPPLRDANKELRSKRGSRLARLLINLSREDINGVRESGELLEIEEEMKTFNQTLEGNERIKKANQLINSSLKETLGEVFAQSTKIQFSDFDFEKIVQSLQLLFFPFLNDSKDVVFRDLAENSLGYNNLIYLATILAEFEGLKSDNRYPRLLLIEEPEAHLHPQLQIRLLKYLAEQAENNHIQVIVTTHSPVLASSVSIEKIKVMSLKDKNKIEYTSIKHSGIEEKSRKFIDRWLDATRSTLFFSKGIIFVEGIAEAILLPTLFNILLKNKNIKEKKLPSSFEESGFSIICLNGIYFEHFFQMYNGYKIVFPEQATKGEIRALKRKSSFEQQEINACEKIPIKCIGLTDNDPEKDKMPTKSSLEKGKNHVLYLEEQLKNMTDNCRLFKNLKTFEYDLGLDIKNLEIMIKVFLELLETDGDIRDEYGNYLDVISKKSYDGELEDFLKTTSFKLLKKIDSTSIGKGLFAQELHERIKTLEPDGFAVPYYVKEAFAFLYDIEVSELE